MHYIHLVKLHIRLLRSLGQGNVFTPMCHSVHGGGGLHPGGVCIGMGGLHPGGGQTPLDTTGYGKRAGGTHPT